MIHDLVKATSIICLLGAIWHQASFLPSGSHLAPFLGLSVSRRYGIGNLASSQTVFSELSTRVYDHPTRLPERVAA